MKFLFLLPFPFIPTVDYIADIVVTISFFINANSSDDDGFDYYYASNPADQHGYLMVGDTKYCDSFTTATTEVIVYNRDPSNLFTYRAC